MLDIFFEALNYETIEQKKAYEVAGLLGEHCGLVAVLRAQVGTLQCSPMCCHSSPGAPWCAHSVGAEQSRATPKVTAATSSALSLLHPPPVPC